MVLLAVAGRIGQAQEGGAEETSQPRPLRFAPRWSWKLPKLTSKKRNPNDPFLQYESAGQQPAISAPAQARLTPEGQVPHTGEANQAPAPYPAQATTWSGPLQTSPGSPLKSNSPDPPTTSPENPQRPMPAAPATQVGEGPTADPARSSPNGLEKPFDISQIDQAIWGSPLQRPAASAPPEAAQSSARPSASLPEASPPLAAVTATGPLSSAPSTPAPQPSALHGSLDDGTRLLAVVGSESILAGDLLGQVNDLLEPYRTRLTAEELETERERLIQQMLPHVVERKLVILDFLRDVPAERMPDLREQVYKSFQEERLPEVLQKTKLGTAVELDAKLRTLGSSLAKQQEVYFEQMVGRLAVQKNVDINPEVTHDELLDYYRRHSQDYDVKARARWERLTVRFDRFASREEAYQAMVRMGNEVLGGAPLSAVAKRSSQDPQAHLGGQYDWTTQGSLVSKELDRLIFSMPVGRLSRIIEDGQGYHIVRVLEREEAGRIPFTEVQDEITEKIREERRQQGLRKYIDRLRSETPVWTIYDRPTGKPGT
jgi:hypothetical protein